MAKVKDAEPTKDTIEKIEKDVNTLLYKVKQGSEASDKTTCAPGINENKKARYGKPNTAA